MGEIKLDFEGYVNLACQYAYMEYDFGIESEYAIFQLDEFTIEMLGLCWVSKVSVPDAAHLVAIRAKN